MAQLRIGIGRFWHESNSFSSVQTESADFDSYQGGTLLGSEILSHPERRDEVAGALEIFGRSDRYEVVPLISAGALPSGLLSPAVTAHLEDSLRKQLEGAGRLDGVCLALHGAMSAASAPDFDGHVLHLVREHVGEQVPIVVALDCHAVVTDTMIELADALVAYRTHPHVDIVATGSRAAQMLVDTIEGRITPGTAYQKIPLIFPPPDDGTHTGALKELFDEVIAWDRIPGVVAGSVCPGFPHQDVPGQGVTVLAVTDDDPTLGDRLTRQAAELAWDARERFMPDPMLSPEAALQQAAGIEGCPVVITDSADTVGGGAPGDNTALLDTVLKHRGTIDGLILAHLPDPQAVAALKSAELHDTVTVTVGGKRDTRFCSPLSVTAKLLVRATGPISDDAGAGTEAMIETGAILCLGIDNVRLVLTERTILGPQPSLYRAVGIEPFAARVVTLKTGIGYKMTYSHAAKAVIRADCPGAQSYNLANYDFGTVSRPMYPLDPQADWRPHELRYRSRGRS